MDSFRKDLRGVLIADKNGIPIHKLNREYKDLTGEDIKWNLREFPTLYHFLLSLSDACEVREVEGELLVLPVASEKNKVINDLVIGQRDKKQEQRRKGKRFHFGHKILGKYQRRREGGSFGGIRSSNFSRSSAGPVRNFSDDRFNGPRRPHVNHRFPDFGRTPEPRYGSYSSTPRPPERRKWSPVPMQRSPMRRLRSPERKQRSPEQRRHLPVERPSTNRRSIANEPFDVRERDRKRSKEPADVRERDRKLVNEPADIRVRDRKSVSEPADVRERDRKSVSEPADIRVRDRKSVSEPADVREKDRRSTKEPADVREKDRRSTKEPADVRERYRKPANEPYDIRERDRKRSQSQNGPSKSPDRRARDQSEPPRSAENRSPSPGTREHRDRSPDRSRKSRTPSPPRSSRDTPRSASKPVPPPYVPVEKPPPPPGPPPETPARPSMSNGPTFRTSRFSEKPIVQINNYLASGKQLTSGHARQARDSALLNGDRKSQEDDGRQYYGDVVDEQFLSSERAGASQNRNNLITITTVDDELAPTPASTATSSPPPLPQTNGPSTSELNQAFLRDPRRRNRSFSFGGNAATKSTRPSLIQSFDVRSTQKPISIKFFSKRNLSETVTPSSVPKAEPAKAARAPEVRSRKDLFDVNNNDLSDEVEILDDDYVKESDIGGKTRDYSPDYRKKKEQQKAPASPPIESDYEFYQEPQTARRSKVPLYNINDYIPRGVLITTESLRSYARAATRLTNKPRSIVESRTITREQLRRINEINKVPFDAEFEEVDEHLNLDRVTISSACEQSIEIGTRFALEKLTRASAYRATLAMPSAINEFVPAQPGYFVPAMPNQREKNVNIVMGNELKNLDTKINYKIELKQFVKEHNLPDPEFQQPVYIDNNALSGYSSRLKIGDKTWFTVLDAHQTPDDADNNVAKRALDELKLIVNLQSQQKEDNDLISKIIKLFNDKSESLYSNIVERRFLDVYKQNLNADWLNWIKNNPSASLSIKEHPIGDDTYYTVTLVS